MNAYVKKIIAKAERRNEEREANKIRHLHSVRYDFKPLTETELDIAYETIQIHNSIKIKVCQGIISEYCEVFRPEETDLNILESAVEIIRQHKAKDFKDKKKLIKVLRNELPIKFSARKLRMFYHMRAAGARHDHINGYNACIKLLTTWELIYGREWQGEPFEIDHIIPISIASNRQELRDLNRIDNLCMLYPKHNKKKGSKFPNKIYYLLRG